MPEVNRTVMSALQLRSVAANLVEAAATIERDYPGAILLKNAVGNYAVLADNSDDEDPYFGYVDMVTGNLHVGLV